MTLLYIIGAVAIVWFAFKMIRNNPDMFSKANLEKSIFTTGVLTLTLIAFIALLVYLLKH